jgi:transcriptional regulator with XRE-family HTH domain
MDKQIGERVARVRGEMKMTQAELAREMSARLGREIKPLTVTRLEGGKRPILADEVIAASEALHVEPMTLLSDKGFAVGTVRLISEGRQALEAAHRAHMAIGDWIKAQTRLRQKLDKLQKHWEQVPWATKIMISATAEWSLDEVVAEAMKAVEDDDAKA